jgi:hypothetical protein
MQVSIRKLIELGKLPSIENADASILKKYQDLLLSIEEPITDEEAVGLMGVLGPDDCFGLAWTLIHIAETAPGWPLREALADVNSEWVKTIMQRAEA